MEVSGYIALVVAIIGSRIINERGYKLLSSEEKVRLLDGFSKTRAYAMIPVLALIGGYFFLMKNTSLDKGLLSIGYFGSLILYSIIRTIMNHKKMSSLKMPDGYRRLFMISQIISLIGVAWFFYALFAPR